MHKDGVGIPLALCALAGTSRAAAATFKSTNQAAAVLDPLTSIEWEVLVRLQ
jgi:hypothetical protein